MKLDIAQLAKDMFNAAFPILKEGAPEVAGVAQGEFKKIAQQFLTIEEELAAGQITADQARILVEMQKSASRVVLLSFAGLSLLIVENALNAALKVVRTALNAAAGIALL